MESVNKELQEHIEVINQVLDTQLGKIEEIARSFVECYKNGGKLIFFGNGGSAADAQHLAAEFVGRYKLERKSLFAIALTTNTSILTAIANDYDFDTVFERQVQGVVSEADVVLGISTSGNSENVLRGIVEAKRNGAKTVAFTGEDGGKLKDEVDVLLNIPSDNTPRIQEAHILVGHIISGLVETQLFADKESNR